MPHRISDAVNKKFVYGIKLSLAVNVLSMGLLYLTHVVLARMMKAEQYGVYIYVLSWLSILVLVGKMGLDMSLQRFFPAYAAQNRWALCRGILVRSYQLALCSSAMLAGTIWWVAGYFRDGLGTGVFQTFMVSVGVLPLLVLIKLTQGFLIALKKPAQSQIPDGIITPLLLVFFVVLWSKIYETPAYAPMVMSVLAFVYLVVLVLSMVWVRYYLLPDSIRHVTGEYRTKEWMLFSLPVVVISGMYVVMNYTDVIMIGMIEGTTQSGIYAAASRVATIVSLSLVIVNMVLVPYISELYHNQRHYELQHLVSVSVRIASVLAIPLFVAIWFFGDAVLGLFGSEFVSGKRVLFILAIGQLVNVLSGSVGFLMIMCGRQRQAAYVLALSAVINIALNAILIPRYGINGAAIATAFSIMLWNIVFVLYIRKKMQINPTLFRMPASA